MALNCTIIMDLRADQNASHWLIHVDCAASVGTHALHSERSHFLAFWVRLDARYDNPRNFYFVCFHVCSTASCSCLFKGAFYLIRAFQQMIPMPLWWLACRQGSRIRRAGWLDTIGGHTCGVGRSRRLTSIIFAEQYIIRIPSVSARLHALFRHAEC